MNKRLPIPRSFLFIMKLSFHHLLLSVLLSGLATAADVSGQEILRKSVTLNVKDAKLKSVLRAIESQVNVHFIYSSSSIDLSQPVTVRANSVQLESVLSEIFDPIAIEYSVSDNRIMLKHRRKKPESSNHPQSEALPSNLEKNITGVVRDENGQGLPGVSIVLKGKQLGTVSDAGGKFNLSAGEEDLAPGAILVFSYISYETKEVPLGNQNSLEVALAPEDKTLSEVVVVGFGTQRKADITGSVVSIKPEVTSDLPNYNVLQSLQGRVPGLRVTSPDHAGESPALNIRGTNSISAGTSPLIVVDGIIYNGSISDFNANDIASVDVLKDASATAVYGSRAANGVVIITTKTGTTNTPEFNFNTYLGVERPSRLVKVLDGRGYLQKILDFRTSKKLEADPTRIDSYLTVAEAQNRSKGVTTNWMDHVIRPGVVNNYHLDISGRSDKVNYYMAATYFKQKGIVRNDNYKRATFNLNLTTHITDWYSVSVKSAFSSQDFSGLEASLADAFRQSPYGDFNDPQGPGGYARFPVGDPGGLHPLMNTLIDNKDIRNSLFGIFSSNLDVPFIPGLKWTVNYSANLRTQAQSQWANNKVTPTAMTANGIATKATQSNHDWTFDNIFNYKRNFGARHALDVTGLVSRQKQSVETNSLTGQDFFTQNLGYNAIDFAVLQKVGSNFEDQNMIAYMGRINYSFDRRYALTLTTRKDGYSGFSKGNKFGIFPSAAVAWTASNEKFFESVKWLNHLKVRASYGKNGNQAVGRYQSLSTIANNQYIFGGQTTPTTYVNRMTNNALTWETTLSKNFGIDFEILNHNLSGSVDIYSSNTTDLLLNRALPGTSGFTNTLTNIGKVHNRGVEISVGSTNLKLANGLVWESGLVFALNRNRIVQLTGQDANNDGIEDNDINNGWFIGESIQSIFGYKTDGIYQLTDSDIPAGFQPGDFRIVDTNKDGVLNAADRTVLGTQAPNYTASLSNTLRYKGFSLYAMLTTIQGGGKKNYFVGNNAQTRNPNNPFTTFTERFNVQDVPYWTPQRPSNEYPRIDYNATLPHPILESRSFVRLQDVSLSYSFDKDFLRKTRLKNLRIYASGKNIFTITKWTGYDPEKATGMGDFPFFKSYTLGIDVKF